MKTATKALKSIESLEFAQHLEASLYGPNSVHGEFPELVFGNYNHFYLTPSKGYTARMDVPVHFGSSYPMTIIAFAPGDGTGNSDTYNPAQFSRMILHGETTADRITPRSKKGILFEVCVPLFTFNNGKGYPGLASLEVLTVDNPEDAKHIYCTDIIGEEQKDFRAHLSAEPVRIPRIIQATTGHQITGERFGDPHAIYCPRVQGFDNALQVVGFISIKEKNGLCGYLEKVVSRKFPGL